MKNLVKRLEKIGWSKKEIGKAVRIIIAAKKNKPAEAKIFEKKIYWLLLVLIIAANFSVSISLIPILIALKGFSLYFIITIIGVVFGLLFELVIRSIEHLEKKHYVLLAIFIPLIALVNIFAMSKTSNELMTKLALANLHVPAIISLIYALSFTMPYIIYRFILKIEYYSKE